VARGTDARVEPEVGSPGHVRQSRLDHAAGRTHGPCTRRPRGSSLQARTEIYVMFWTRGTDPAIYLGVVAEYAPWLVAYRATAIDPVIAPPVGMTA
jgi:hypothetical protein